MCASHEKSFIHIWTLDNIDVQWLNIINHMLHITAHTGFYFLLNIRTSMKKEKKCYYIAATVLFMRRYVVIINAVCPAENVRDILWSSFVCYSFYRYVQVHISLFKQMLFYRLFPL